MINTLYDLRDKILFMHHNKAYFDKTNKKIKCHGSNIFLVELNSMSSSHISYSYVATYFKDKGCRIIGYTTSNYSFPIRILKYISKFFGLGHFGVYKSFGVEKFISPRLSFNQHKHANELYLTAINQLRSKEDLVSLKLNNVWIGDLVYDTYLMRYKLPTINIFSLEFRKFLKSCVQLYVFFDNLIDSNVVGVNVSHCVYLQALPLRIAVSRNIRAFQSNCTHLYSLDSKNLFAYNDFFYYREQFQELAHEDRISALNLAKERISLRFSGVVGVDMNYSTKSAYTDVKYQRLIKKSNAVNVLIAPHCFFDSPHSFGINLFPDFYEWIDFLGRYSKNVDYNWYIKTHPDVIPENDIILQSFVQKYPKFNILPKDASHHQIIAEGIDCALTTYGTIGFEYAALGVTVINASVNNPHIAYNFNLHPKSIEEYRCALNNIKKIKVDIDINEVYEYYFMRFVYNTQNIFFDNYQFFLDSVGGYMNQFKSSSYRYWVERIRPEKHDNLKKSIANFIESGDFRMGYHHMVL